MRLVPAVLVSVACTTALFVFVGLISHFAPWLPLLAAFVLIVYFGVVMLRST